ncbi:MAG: phosphatase PAP2 family protein [Aeromicrobium sp.]
MKWPTWYHGAILAALCAAIWWMLGRVRPNDERLSPRLVRTSSVIRPAAQELAVVASLYAIWRIARKLPLATAEGAIERARQIDDFQHWLRFPSELSLQRFVLDYDWLARATNTYYATIHVPATIAFLVWLFVRHRDEYPHWRNGLAIVTGFCLVIRFVRVAPPRFLPDLGYIDLATRYGMSLYGPVGTGVSDQFAAMPSIHVGWAAVVALGTFAMTRSPWRWIVLLHLPVTVLVVAATGHHWWLDGVVAVLLLLGGLVLDGRLRRRTTAASEDRQLGEYAPTPWYTRT